MKQIILKRLTNAGYGIWNADSTYAILQGGTGTFVHGTLSFGNVNALAARTVFAVPVTLSNLLVTSNVGDGTLGSYQLIVLKNGVETPLRITSPGGTSVAEDVAHVVSYAAGDDVSLKLITTAITPLGTEMGVSLECNTVGAENVYSTTSIAYGVPGSGAVGATSFGGAFDNGYDSGYAGQPNSNNYSICAVPGAITKIALKRYYIPVDGGYTVQFTVGGVLTPVVATFMDSVGEFEVISVNVPVALTQRVDMLVTRIGTPTPISYTHASVSIAYTPTVPGQFMFCGGSNDAQPNEGWLWNRNNQNSLMFFDRTQMKIGRPGVTILGLYMERGAVPDGSGSTNSIHKNGVNTAISFTMTGAQTSGFSNGSVEFTNGDTVSIHTQPVGGGGNPGAYWGIAALAYRDRSGLYEVKPGTRDKYYGDVEKKIPDPTVKTALIGE